MNKDSVVEFRKPEEAHDAFTAFIRQGAQRLIAQAVQAELEAFLAAESPPDRSAYTNLDNSSDHRAL